uniref:Uncharacterized protein n=1 Tax=Salarias fasciatus TaxID=181472 RepID=A0A672HMS1_SALFA
MENIRINKCVYRLSLHVNIHTALSRHHAAVCVLQDRFQEGTAKLGKQQQLRPCFMESKDVALLDFALKKLAAATGRLRTALWCSLQMTTALPVETPDQQADGEDAPHCQGYSFNI